MPHVSSRSRAKHLGHGSCRHVDRAAAAGLAVRCQGFLERNEREEMEERAEREEREEREERKEREEREEREESDRGRRSRIDY